MSPRFLVPRLRLAEPGDEGRSSLNIFKMRLGVRDRRLVFDVRGARHGSQHLEHFKNGVDLGHGRAHSVCRDRKSTRLNSRHTVISYAVFCLKKKTELRSLSALQPDDSSPTVEL